VSVDSAWCRPPSAAACVPHVFRQRSDGCCCNMLKPHERITSLACIRPVLALCGPRPVQRAHHARRGLRARRAAFAATVRRLHPARLSSPWLAAQELLAADRPTGQAAAWLVHWPSWIPSGDHARPPGCDGRLVAAPSSADPPVRWPIGAGPMVFALCCAVRNIRRTSPSPLEREVGEGTKSATSSRPAPRLDLNPTA